MWITTNTVKKALAVFCLFDEVTNIFQVVISMPEREDYENPSPVLQEQQYAERYPISSNMCQFFYICPKSLPTVSFPELVFFEFLFSCEIAPSSLVKLFGFFF